MSRTRKTLYGVILAGGSGTRFWPLSRLESPKQLLRLTGDETLLELTIKRLKPLISSDRIFIVTNPTHGEFIRLYLMGRGETPLPQFITEPAGRNTAPAIGLAAIRLLELAEDPIMVVLPSDHIVERPPTLRRLIRVAARVAEGGWLVTFGVNPTRPETGYGYIKTAQKPLEKRGGVSVMKVERFVEKPTLKRARRYIKDGGYYWNSGIFVWKARSILEAIKSYLPELYEKLMAIRDGGSVEKVYDKIEPVSIDTGVLEKTRNVALIEAGFGWSDMGSWNSLEHIFSPDDAGNIIRGRVVDIDSRNSFIIAQDRLVATIGLEDIIVADTPDATLVCSKERAQDVKKVVDILKSRGYREFQIHRTVERPWGSYTVLEHGDGYKIKKIRVEPRRRLSLQLHRKRSEHWIVLSGRARIQRGEEVMEIGPNQSTYIPKGVKHRLENPSTEEPLEIIEVQAGSYVEEDDIERFEDDFERR